jgi:serine/threonine protein phosphatase PrpC
MKYINRSLTDVGRVRSANEDSLGEFQTLNGHLFVVCDGMGGHVGGATASSKAVESLIEFFNKDNYDNPIQALDHALSFANEQIYATAMIQPEFKGMGTTAVVVLVRNEECYIAHVGDSRIYLFSDGKLYRLTKDHSYVQTLVDANIIADEDAENHPNKNQILQALGIAPVVKSTVCLSPVLPKKGDVFLLCSDGLNGMVNDREMERLMNENGPEDWSQVLVNAALEAGGKDNVTASLIEITESSHLDSSFVNFNPVSADHLNRTREVNIEDLNANSASKNGMNKSTKRMYLFAGLGFLLSAIAFLILFIIKKPEETEKQATPPAAKPTPQKSVLISKDSINKVLGNCDTIALMGLNKKKSAFFSDTLRNECVGYHSQVIVGKDSMITVSIINNQTDKTNATLQPKSLTKDRYVTTSSKEFNTMEGILKHFQKECPNVKMKDIIDYTVKNNKDLKDKKLELEASQIQPDWKILCPPCNPKKQ